MDTAKLSDTDSAELAAYRATGMTPDDVAQFVAEQRAICVKCTGNAEGVFLEQIGEPWDCKLTSCKSHRWRHAWYKM